MIEPNKNEHDRIASFLKKDFLPFCSKYGYKFNIDLIKFLAVLKNSYKKDQEEIATQYSNKARKEVSQSKISRVINKINEKLKKFCDDFNIDPPIQMFNHYIDPISNKRMLFGLFLACANPQVKNGNAALVIVPFKKPKEYVSQKSIVREADSDNFLNLRLTVLEMQPHNQNCNYFRYEYQFPKNFLGRDTELKRLEEFINYPSKKLLWWIISGKAGTGKSRLALELCISLKKQGWYAGFLRDVRLLHKWQQPSKPTLIILDYTYDNAEKLGKHILNIFDKHENWKYPVRILFLTRYEDNDNITQFSEQHPEIIGRILCYNNILNVDETDSLVLGNLNSSSHIDSIILEIFNTIYNKEPTSNDIQAIKEFLRKEVHCNTPLYTMFIADAYARSGNIRNWDKEILLKEHITHNTTIWKSAGIDPHNTLDRKHINLLILSTIANGVNISDTEYSRCLASHVDQSLKPKDILPEKHEFYEDKYHILCDNPDKVNQAPILPDILGEYYFLQCWKGSSAQVNKIELLTLIAWDYKSGPTADFIVRFFQDFPEVNILDKITALLAKIPGNTRDRAIVLYNICLIYCKVNMPDKAEGVFSQLAELWENDNQDDCDISLIYANAAYNMSKCYGVRKYAEQQCDKAYKYCKYIELLWRYFHRDDLEITYILAKAEYNLMYFIFNFTYFDRMKNCYDILKYLYLTGFPKDERIKWLIVQALVSLIWYCAELKNSEAIKFFQEFEVLSKEYDLNNREIHIERLNVNGGVKLYHLAGG